MCTDKKKKVSGSSGPVQYVTPCAREVSVKCTMTLCGSVMGGGEDGEEGSLTKAYYGFYWDEDEEDLNQ